MFMSWQRCGFVFSTTLAGLCLALSSCVTTPTHLTSADEIREQLEICRRQHASQVSSAEVDALRAELRHYASVAEAKARREVAMQRVMNDYSRGVCLIHGIFTLRQLRAGALVPIEDDEGNAMELEYLGSGFLATQRGHVITNRHVAEPWWNNDTVAPLIARGLRPAFVRLTAVFPEHEPVTVDPASIRVAGEDADMAVLVAPVNDVPVLPLSDQDPRGLRGARLMLLGYPTGLAALLARADPSVAAAALEEAHDTASLILALSRRHAIAPVITHGTLSNVTTRQLIYDAVTTSGGSGGPVFGPDGEIIGVNFAILRDFQGSNFGVPIRFARPLLRNE